MELADARFSGYKAKVPLNLALRAPNLACALSSTLQILWRKKFSERSKLSVSAAYGAGFGRRPVFRL